MNCANAVQNGQKNDMKNFFGVFINVIKKRILQTQQA